MKTVVVVGGGASGMMAAYAAAKAGHKVVLLEKNEKLGKKIYITGKGRCNFTNVCEPEDFFPNIVTNPKFLYSALAAFRSWDMVSFLEEFGTKVKVERGNRAFPVSDHASDVTKALEKAMSSVGVTVRLHTKAAKVLTAEDEAGIRACGVLLSDGEKIPADAVIIASGGLSYPSTGSSGEGHRMLEEAGCKVTAAYPALVPFMTKEDFVPLQGLSLKNVGFRVLDGKKVLYDGFGEMLFTHFGVSGPLVLSASSYVTKALTKKPLTATIDLKPALSAEKLDQRIQRETAKEPKKTFGTMLKGLLPGKLREAFLERLSIRAEKPLSQLTREDRHRLISLLKDFRFTVTATRGFNEAIITQGGISVKEINPSTMEVKRLPGLYVCGELLDVDALTGGFNLQIAFSTGYLAGSSI